MSKSTDSELDDKLSALEQTQSDLNRKVVRMKLRCNTSVTSISALKYSKRASFDLSKLVPSDTIS